MKSPYGHIKTYDEAVTAVSEMSDATKLVFEPWNENYKAAAAENPGKRKVSPKRVLELMNSTSASSFYYWLPLMMALGSGAEPKRETASEESSGYTPTPEILALFAPVKQGLDMLPELLERLLSSTTADQVNQVRRVFAQERGTLMKAQQQADSYASEVEEHIQVLVGENVYLRDGLAVNRAEKEAIEQRLGSATEEIKEQGTLLQVTQARITGLVDLGEAHMREVAIVKADKDAQMKRADKAEDENRELRQLREQANERSRRDLADLQARHAAEVAALRQEFSREVGVERDRVSQLELALVNALGTAVDANAARKEVSHV